MLPSFNSLAQKDDTAERKCSAIGWLRVRKVFMALEQGSRAGSWTLTSLQHSKFREPHPFHFKAEHQTPRSTTNQWGEHSLYLVISHYKSLFQGNNTVFDLFSL